MIIVKKEKCLEIDGALYPFNSFQVAQMRNGVRLLNITTSQSIDVPLSASVDGQTFSTVIELVEWFAENGFKNGGGSGEGATWSEITGKPTGTDRQVLGFSGSGQMQATTLGWKQFSDLPTPPPFENGVFVGSAFNESGEATFGFVNVAIQEPQENSFAFHRPDGNGQLAVEDAIEDKDAVNLGQINAMTRFVEFTTDGGSDTIEYTHGLTPAPRFAFVQSANGVSGDVDYVTVNATTVFINHKAATPSGTNNLAYFIILKM